MDGFYVCAVGSFAPMNEFSFCDILAVLWVTEGAQTFKPGALLSFSEISLFSYFFFTCLLDSGGCFFLFFFFIIINQVGFHK